MNNAGDKSLFASYVSPLLRKISSVWESIGGSTDASSLERQQSLDKRPVLGLTEKLMNGSDISLRDPFQKQVTFTSSPAKLLLER